MYLHWCRCNQGTNVVQDLFWTHPDSVKLLNSFNIVLMMDSTYKTNKYRLPLLEIVGMTSIGLKFSAAFILVKAERENNFVWALERLKGLFTRVDAYPKVIVSDRDLGLMKAIRVVFPESCNVLCRFHIDKNVKAKCKMIVHLREAWDQVMEAWGSIVDCETEQKFEDCVIAFKVVCSPWPIFVDYVLSTWVLPYKEKFVKAWTDKLMHLGNTTSNRYVT